MAAINRNAHFSIGQVIHHKLFDYRGVITDVDASFQGTDEWYQAKAPTNPPRDKPWYHVLVDDTDYMTYVAEQNLELDQTSEPIHHPELEYFFQRYEQGRYLPRRLSN